MTLSAEKENTLVQNIVVREREIESYQINIDNYTLMIQNLPAQWPEELLAYKGMNGVQMAAQVPLEALELVSDLNFRDGLVNTLKTEMIEQRKSQKVHEALTSQIDPLRLPDLLAAARIAMNP